ncbi:MAG: uroporphyrinogen-III C-methyltransferase [Acidobacteria bacterium]|nr:uroporphyrinogen-III C-methyltransferase [Acidobacteriota bacterium]
MYPVMLEVRDRRCLVVGGGGVALRKVQGLVEEGARVTVIAPEVVEPLIEMAAQGEIVLERRPYHADAVDDYHLVFAATDDREVNARVFSDAEEAGIWANVADDPELCSFHLPARVRRGPLQLAIGSAGEAPFVVRRLRQLLERRFGPEWGEWLSAAARYRRAVRESAVEPELQEVRYDRFFASTVDPWALTARVPTAAEEQKWLETPVDHLRPAAEPVRGHREDADGKGIVSLVGSGPGCAGLLTLRGHRRLMAADAVVYDRLAAAALPCDLAPEVELHPVGKVAGTHPVPQEEINALLVRLARDGKSVVRLKGGDPYVFGRGSEEAEVLAAEGIPFEVVPGVTSGVAALAWAGIPATHRREAVRLTLLTAHEAIKSDGPQVRWDLLAADPHATLVGYMGVTALPQVVAKLLEAGMDPETPAAMVEQGTTAAQRRVVATLAKLPGAVEQAGLQPPAVFAIGPTVEHAEVLDWYSQLPLAGHRLLVPANGLDLADRLEVAGAELVLLPLPVTPAARVVMGALPLTGCVVRSAAEVDWLDEERGGPGWEEGVTAWCVGREAAERARERGWPQVHEIAAGVDSAEIAAQIAGGAGAGSTERPPQ